MRSEQLIDPQLLEILKQMPSLETSAATLSAMREAMVGWKLTAPDASEVRSEERFIDATDGRQVRVIVYHPENQARTGALLWIHGGGMVMGTPEMNDAPNRYIAQQACPAMPVVIVAISNGATIMRINRRNSSPRKRVCTATRGTSIPSSAPASIERNVHNNKDGRNTPAVPKKQSAMQRSTMPARLAPTTPQPAPTIHTASPASRRPPTARGFDCCNDILSSLSFASSSQGRTIYDRRILSASAITSVYFSPDPVLKSTTRSVGFSVPLASSLS